MNTNDKIKRQELINKESQEERELLVMFFRHRKTKQYKLTPSNHRVDAFVTGMTSGDSNNVYALEAKKRDVPDRPKSDNWDNSILLEKHKFEASFKYALQKGCTPYYVNFFKNNRVVIFDMTRFCKNPELLKWEEGYFPNNQFDKTLIKKQVTYLTRDRSKGDVFYEYELDPYSDFFNEL